MVKRSISDYLVLVGFFCDSLILKNKPKQNKKHQKEKKNRNIQFIFSTIFIYVTSHLFPINILFAGIPSEAQICIMPLGRRNVERTSVSYPDGSLLYIYLLCLPSNILHGVF